MLILVFVIKSHAQQKELKEEDASVDNRQLNEAKAAFASGNRLFERGEEYFFRAKKEFEKAYAFYPDHPLINYRLGICYLNTGEKSKAHVFFEKALRLNNEIDPDIYFYLGNCFQLESVWDSALFYYNRCESALSMHDVLWYDRSPIEKRKQECKNGILLSLKPPAAAIKNLGANINTMYPEYTPYITTDESKIFFTSRRESTTGNNIDEHDGRYFEDIYISSKINGEWTPAINAGTNINSRGHDAVCGIFPDGHTMIIFKGDINGGDLFYVKYENGQWSKPMDFGKQINTEYHESSACLSSDGKQIYFVSDKPGGYGGRDIYMSTWNNVENEWGVAMNLGPEINTVFDEEGVFLHPDNKILFFASNGLLSIGGYDIMKSEKVDNKWMSPVNLGLPVNTPDDDVFVSVSASGKNIYFSSYRKEGFGEKDIYEAMMEDTNTKLANMLMLTGEVVEESTGLPIDAKIDLVNLSNNEKIGTYTNDKETGKYVIPLPGGVKYGTVVYADGYIFESENVEVSDTASFAEISHHTRLKKIETGMIARMNNIFFETGKSNILPSSTNELDRIAAFLNKNEKIEIEIQGHSDNVGDAESNMQLSTRRAEAVYQELIKRSIAASRLSFKGYGETKPAADNKTEKGRSLNRRIEFWIMDDGIK